MRLKYKRFFIVLISVYLISTAFAAYLLFKRNFAQDARINQSEEPDQLLTAKKADTSRSNLVDWDFSLDDFNLQETPVVVEADIRHVVEIWGKAAIGNYLWEHILGGEVIPKLNGVWSYGTVQTGDLLFRFRTGPGLVPEKAPEDVENLILVLNGREPKKVDFAKVWLDYLPNYEKLHNVAVVLLGNEQCDNDWIKPYLTMNGGLVQFVFVVYDSPDVDDVNFYQWPLGVATYRKFPRVAPSSITSEKKRFFRCNFLGTIYKNSTREILLKLLQDPDIKELCYTKPRMHWWPEETSESQANYIHALLQSDLTLNPVGLNAECYRIYEAMSYGSIPVIEDIKTPGRCSSPFRLLKKYHAPVLFIRQWTELKSILMKTSIMNVENMVSQRNDILKWYVLFKQKMKDKFVEVLKHRFFHSSE